MPVREQRDYRDEPTYWFAALEIARERGDFERAAQAQCQLERLGVTVRYGRAQRPRQLAGKGGQHAD